MITEPCRKIIARSLKRFVYVDELPINYYVAMVEEYAHNVNRKSFRIMNREHKINAYPEE